MVFTLLFDIGQYLVIIKNFPKRISIFLKIFHSKFTEKKAFRKPMFQSRIPIFLPNNKDTVLDKSSSIILVTLTTGASNLYPTSWHEVSIGSQLHLLKMPIMNNLYKISEREQS